MYSAELDAIISGGEDGVIRIFELAGVGLQKPKQTGTVVADGSADILVGHTGRVSGLACVGEHVLASVSQDATLRFWDLHTKHELAVVEKAHDEPIVCLEYAAEREELATCASAELVVRIWDAFQYSLAGKLAGHTAEVTSVKWVGWKEMWITASSDESIRFWSGADQACVRSFRFRGESVSCMMVDPVYKTLLAAMTDFQLRIYDVDKVLNSHGDDVLPIRKHMGHTEPIRAMCLVEEKRQYLTASWDKTVRVWTIPHHDRVDAKAAELARAEAAVEEDAVSVVDDDCFVSRFERANPLVQPKTLKANANADFAAKLAKGDGGMPTYRPDLPEEMPLTQLGSRLKEAEDELQRAHYTEKKVVPGKSSRPRRRNMSLIGSNVH